MPVIMSSPRDEVLYLLFPVFPYINYITELTGASFFWYILRRTGPRQGPEAGGVG